MQHDPASFSSLPLEVVTDCILEFHAFPIQRWFFSLDYTKDEVDPMQCSKMIHIMFGYREPYREPRLLFKHLDCRCMKFDGVKTDDLRYKHGRHVQFLDLKSVNISFKPDAIQSFIQNNPHLERIDIYSIDMRRTEPMMPALLDSLSSIDKITLSCCTMIDDDIPAFSKFKNIRELDSGGSYICDQISNPINLMKALASMSSLRKCDIKYSGVSDELLMPFLGNRYITEINLFGNRLTVDGISVLASMSNLRTLTLSLDDNGCKAISASSLRTLHLRNKGVKRVFVSGSGLSALNLCQTLKHLRIGCSIDDNILKDWCVTAINLKSLFIESKKITAAGAASIAAAMKSLECLSLTYCRKLKLAGIESIASITSLTRLNLIGSSNGDMSKPYAKIFSNLIGLRHLSIDYYPCSNFETLQYTNPSLKCLKLNVEEYDFDRNVIECLIGNTCLTKLILMDSAHLKNSYLKCIKYNSTLETLRILRCPLIGEDLFKYLIKNETLTSLTLYESRISSDYSLRPFIERCTNITYLDIGSLNDEEIELHEAL